MQVLRCGALGVDVTVHPLAEGMWSNVPFVAVNREQILSLEEEDTPLLKVERAD